MYDIVVIGAGPAGYTAALRAGQLGLRAVVVDPAPPGGRGVARGVVFLKSLMASAERYTEAANSKTFGVEGIDPKQLSFNWKNAVQRAHSVSKRMSRSIEQELAANGVEIVQSRARVASANTVNADGQSLEGRHIIIATGASPTSLPFSVPRDNVVSVWEVGGIPEIPKKLAVYGSNTVAVEYAQLFSKLGSQVTLAGDGNPLLPGLDRYLAERYIEQLNASGVTVVERFDSASFGNGKLKLDEMTVDCESIINAGPPEALLPEVDVTLEHAHGFIVVNERLQTSEPSIYAVGDVNGRSLSARQASEQGYAAVELTVGHKRPTMTRFTPYLLHGEPEVAQIGSTGEQLRSQGIPYGTVELSLENNVRALIEDAAEGFVRLLYARKSGAVLGVQILAHGAVDMASEAMELLRFGASVSDLAQIVHAHPTMSEVFSDLGKRAAADL